MPRCSVDRDPFKGRYSEVVLEIMNHDIDWTLEKLKFADPSLDFEVMAYKFEIRGVSKTFCRETKFVEDSRVIISIVYRTTMKNQLIEFINDHFTNCSFYFK